MRRSGVRRKRRAARGCGGKLDATVSPGQAAAVLQALLFDAVGTLIELAEAVGETYARLLFANPSPDLADDLDRRFRDAFRKVPAPDFTRHPDGDRVEREWWRAVVETTVRRPLGDGAFATVFSHYAMGSAWTVRPGVRETLTRARTDGFRLAVVSNFDRRLHAILRDLGLAPFFDHVVCSADARARKPDAAIFRHALRLLGLRAAEVLHLGDSPEFDGRGAANAGIRAHLLKPGDRTLPEIHGRRERLE